MPSKITAAAQATDVIQTHIDRAADALKIAMANGHGVYSDPSTVYRDLTTARNEIAAAIAAHRATQWPSIVDYDEAENAPTAAL